MSQPTYSEVSEGIAATITAATLTTGIQVVQEQTTLTESIADTPSIQIYMEDDQPEGMVERYTFQAKVRWNIMTWHIDVYAHARGELGENIASVYQYGQAIKDVLNSMKNPVEGGVPPFFGVPGIKTYHWRAQRLQLETAAQGFMAMRFVLTLNLF